MKRELAIFALAFLAAAPAQAKNWVIDYAHSDLGFTALQGSKAVTGSFRTFTADVDFDPAHPETGRISAQIDTASAATGDAQSDSVLPQHDWFDAKKFPQAQFTSTRIRATGSASFDADGTLTIKGMSKNVTLPFTLTQDGDRWRAQGKVTLLRMDFAVGSGEWSNPAYVKNQVDVTVDIAAKPQ